MKGNQFMNSETVVQDLEGRNLGFGSHETFMNAINFEHEVTTIHLLRIHILRLILILLWTIYANFVKIYGFVSEVFQTVTIIHNVLSVNIFNVEKFVQLVAKLVVLIYLNVDQNSLNIVFDFLPKSEELPNSISLILKLRNNPIHVPPEIPQPYLDYDKKLVVPNESEVTEAIRLKNEYFTHQRLFILSEKFRMMNEISKFILWSSLTNIEFINVYESSGILWGNNDVLNIISECVISEIHSQLKCSSNEESLRNLIPIIELIDINLGIEVEININDATIQTSTPEGGYSQIGSDLSGPKRVDMEEDDWIDDVRIRKFKVYLVDKNIHYLKNLPLSSELILNPSSANIKLSGFIRAIEHNQTVLYSNEGKFDFKFFIKSLHQFANSRTKNNYV